MRRKTSFRVSRGERVRMRIDKLVYPEKVVRPKTRGECKDGIRPCPYVGCRYNLYLEVSEAGSITLNYDGEVWEQTESCALDVADRGDHMLEELAAIMNRTREAIRLVEAKALVRFARRAVRTPLAMERTDESIHAELDQRLELVLKTVEPLIGSAEELVVQRARASMYIAFGAMEGMLTSSLRAPEHERSPAVDFCLAVLRWVHRCNAPLEDALASKSLEDLQRFAAGLGIAHEGLGHRELVATLRTYAHTKPPGATPS